jgi:cyclopropane-fatty-acyl-phospholipid synthase
VFTITCHNHEAVAAILSADETRIAFAYINGAIDFEGDMLELFKLRGAISDRHPLLYFWFVHIHPRLFGQSRSDEKWIAQHYDYDNDFYLSFLDRKTRAYSQAIFASHNEPLEVAMERKLQFALDCCQLVPGDRILDIGGGWGSLLEFAGEKGIHVTSITLSGQSERFLQELAEKRGLRCEIRREHFYDHAASQPYDAIFNLGVTEHLPDYRRTLRQYDRLLKARGRVYIDASACREKHSFSSFIYRFIYPGNPTPLCLADYLTEVERSPFRLLELHNDQKNYELTARHWAQNLDRARRTIGERWGEPLYRKFRLYLWGTAHAFAANLMSAYRIVLERPVPERLAGHRWRT